MYDLVVSDDIHYYSAKSTVKKYLETKLGGKPLFGITTDGRKFYKSIMDFFKWSTSICYAHCIKNLNKKFKYILNSCKTEEERNKGTVKLTWIFTIEKSKTDAKSLMTCMWSNCF
jgi:hypothetical protein